MKKLILSAVFAFACFTANAQTKTEPQKVVKETTQPRTFRLAGGSGGGLVDGSPMCYRTYTTTMLCNGLSFTYTGYGFARTCNEALGLAQSDSLDQAYDAVCP